MIPIPMKYSKDGFKLTESFEACIFKAYKDKGGVWTIAWGHTRGVGPGLTCIPQQADHWLIEDASFSEAAVNDLLTIQPTQDEFDALVDFEFNTGGLKGSTMLDLINKGEISEAAGEFDKWDHVNGVEVAGLLRRRETETRLFGMNETELANIEHGPQGAD